uniref:MYCBP-associated protein-like n=1 Tax=Monopterus albus TaxID=43700 RepID=UPI0009B471C0
MRRGVSLKKELRPPNNSENKKLKTPLELSILGDDQSKNTTFKGDIQALASYPEDLHKVHVPKPPKGRQNPALVACVGNTEPADEDKSAAQGVVAHPVSLDPDSQPLYDTGLEGIRFDDQGMVLPHSILGSLEDFRHFLEATEETELVKRILTSRRDPSAEASESHHAEAVESGVPSGHRNIQSNALKHWHVHMKQRIRQQEFLSDLLDRPVETLLMNQADRFRETQEQRIFLNQVLPLIHSGYGYHVGGEFWSLPQRYGDEMSGITATLTQTEQGSREPVTYVGRPSSILRESGILCDESVRPASRTWDQSTYLQHQYQELRKVLRDTDTKKPDISGLEVIGSGKPFTCVTVSRSPILEKEEEENEQEEMTENLLMTQSKRTLNSDP